MENYPPGIVVRWKAAVENSVENVYNLLYLKLSLSLCEPFSDSRRIKQILAGGENLSKTHEKGGAAFRKVSFLLWDLTEKRGTAV